jgi:type I restriction enzyme S subunit
MTYWESVSYCGISGNKLEKYLLSEGDIVIARTRATTGYAKRINKKHPESIFAYTNVS